MFMRPIGRGPPGRSQRRRRIADWDLPLDGTCTLTRGMLAPGWKGRIE
jgi:hypothetical protein